MYNILFIHKTNDFCKIYNTYIFISIITIKVNGSAQTEAVVVAAAKINGHTFE